MGGTIWIKYEEAYAFGLQSLRANLYNIIFAIVLYIAWNICSQLVFSHFLSSRRGSNRHFYISRRHPAWPGRAEMANCAIGVRRARNCQRQPRNNRLNLTISSSGNIVILFLMRVPRQRCGSSNAPIINIIVESERFAREWVCVDICTQLHAVCFEQTRFLCIER